VCFDYLNKFKSHQVQGLYSGLGNGKVTTHGQAKEATELMNTILSNTFSETAMRRLFDPFIIITAILLTLQRYEPIFTYSFSQQFHQNFDIQHSNSRDLPNLLEKFSIEKVQFLKSFFEHLKMIQKNGTAIEDDCVTVYGELMIELSPKESVDETMERRKSIQILREIFHDWSEVMRETEGREGEREGEGEGERGEGDDSGDVTIDDGSSEPPQGDLYSIQDRTIKITFPKGDDEENTITRPQLTKVMSAFGEISEVSLSPPSAPPSLPPYSPSLTLL
jgi:hypothetical protein